MYLWALGFEKRRYFILKMTTAKSWKIGREIGDAVVKASSNPNRRWYGPHMAASVRAISERIPLVDFVLEIRDARVRLLLHLIVFKVFD